MKLSTKDVYWHSYVIHGVPSRFLFLFLVKLNLIRCVDVCHIIDQSHHIICFNSTVHSLSCYPTCLTYSMKEERLEVSCSKIKLR